MDQDTQPAQTPRLKRRGLLIGVLAVVVVLAVAAVLLFARAGSGPAGNAAIATSQAIATSSAPTSTTTATPTGPVTGSIRLPEGGNAKLVRSDITADGQLPIPEHLDEATWWGANLGAAKGASLMAGHVNWKGQTGPFNELWQDKVGDKVTVVDQSGGTWIFQITSVVTVPKDKLAQQAQQLYGQDGPYRLVLATCGGEFVGGSEGYNDNRFATATLVSRP